MPAVKRQAAVRRTQVANGIWLSRRVRSR